MEQHATAGEATDYHALQLPAAAARTGRDERTCEDRALVAVAAGCAGDSDSALSRIHVERSIEGASTAADQHAEHVGFQVHAASAAAAAAAAAGGAAAIGLHVPQTKRRLSAHHGTDVTIQAWCQPADLPDVRE